MKAAALYVIKNGPYFTIHMMKNVMLENIEDHIQ